MGHTPTIHRLRYTLLIVLLPLMFIQSNAIQGQGDTTKADKKDVKLIEARIKGVDTSLKNLMADTAKFVRKTTTAATGDACKPCQDRALGFWDYILAFLPAILFLVFLTIFLISGFGKFDLKKAMSESKYPTIKIKNKVYEQGVLKDLVSRENIHEIVPATIEVTYMKGNETNPELVDPHPSISRYIAFFASVLTLVVALGISCFYLHHYLRTGCPPELSGITTLLIALGIGILPYVFNKMSGAIGKSNNDLH